MNAKKDGATIAGIIPYKCEKKMAQPLSVNAILNVGFDLSRYSEN